MRTHHLFELPLTLLLISALCSFQQDAHEVAGGGARASEFVLPCDDYRRGIRRRGNFGVLVRNGSPAFTGTYHLAEDVWLPHGTEVRSIGGGVVRYSDFSPTWTDKQGRKHWNLGNVIVIEHPVDPPDGDLKQVCSVYVHLGADRRVQVGDTVTRGQPIGHIGRDRSEENGQYPAHLHFGIHQGPYFQVSPAWKRNLVREAREAGLPTGADGTIVKGEVEITRIGEARVDIKFVDKQATCRLSLLVGSTSPGHEPADIIGWCQGYGTKDAVSEWLRPSEWINRRSRRGE